MRMGCRHSWMLIKRLLSSLWALAPHRHTPSASSLLIQSWLCSWNQCSWVPLLASGWLSFVLTLQWSECSSLANQWLIQGWACGTTLAREAVSWKSSLILEWGPKEERFRFSASAYYLLTLEPWQQTLNHEWSRCKKRSRCPEGNSRMKR